MRYDKSRKSVTKKGKGRRVPASKVSGKMVDKSLRERDFTFRGSQNNNIKPEPFPRVLLTRAKFCQNLGYITAGAGGTATAVSYRLNSVYDPAFALGGGSVAGWTVLNSAYSNYWVMGCKIIVSFSDPEADGVRVGCTLRLDGANAASGKSLEALGATPNTYISAINNTGNQAKTFNLYVKPWSLIGISKHEYLANSASYSSAMNNNPAVPCYMDIFCVKNDGSGVAVKVNCVVKVVYYTKFYNRKELSQAYL